MTLAEFRAALRTVPRVFVSVPCVASRSNALRGIPDGAGNFPVSKALARRLLLDGRTDDEDYGIIAIIAEDGNLYIG